MMPKPLSAKAFIVVLMALTTLGACGASGYVADLSRELEPSEAQELERKLASSLRSQGPDADRYAELANAQFRQGKLRAARVSVQRALGLVSNHPSALLTGARTASKTGEYQRAVAYYDRLALARPEIRGGIEKEWARNVLALGRQHLQKGSAKPALEVVKLLDRTLPEQAEELSEQRGELLLAIARLLLRIGRIDDAGNTLEMAHKGGAPKDDVAFVTASLSLAKERYQEAWLASERWVGDEQREARWGEVGDVALSLGKHEFALDAFQKISATGIVDLKRIANTAMEAGKPDIARDAWLRIAKTIAASPRKDAGLRAAMTLLEAARTLEDRAYLKRAYALYKAATGLAPTHWRVFEATGRFMSERYDHVSAVPKLIQTYVEAMKWSSEALENGTKLLVDTQQVIEAGRLIAKALRRPNAPAILWLKRAEIMHRQQNGPERERALETYVTEAGRHKREVLTRAARAWLAFGVLTQAERLASEAYSMSKGNTETALLMADVHAARGMPRDEKKVINALLKSAPDPYAAALAVGKRYRGLNKFNQAVRLLMEATLSPRDSVRAQAHHQLFELHLRRNSNNGSVAARHLRSWMKFMGGPTERIQTLRKILEETTNNRTIVAVRIEALSGLLKLVPKDATLWTSLGYSELLRKRYPQARKAFDEALKYSKQRAAAAQRFGDRFAQLGQDRTALYFYDMLSPDEVVGTPTSHLAIGRRYDKAGRRKRASEYFDRFYKALAQKPSTKTVVNFGNEMLQSRRLPLARKAFKLALRTNPRQRDAWLGLGKALLRLGDRDQARHAVEKYLSLAPDVNRRAHGLETAATTFEGAGALTDAARLLEELLLLRSSSRGVFRRIAAIYRRIGDPNRLLQVGRLWEESSGRNQRVHTRLEVYRELEKAGFADQAYDGIVRAVVEHKRRRRRSNDLRLLLEAAASNAIKRGRPDQAMKHLEELAMTRSGRPSHWLRTSRILSQAGHPGHAARLLAHPLRQVGAPSELFVARGTYWTDAGNIEAAHKDFAEALQRTVSISETLKKIELVYRKNGHLERLRQLVARAAQLMPNRSRHHLSLGRLLLEQGRVAEASQSFQRFISLKERGQLEVARAYRKAGHPERALRHYLRSYEHTDKGPKVLQEAALLLMHLGNTKKRLHHHIQRFLLASKNPGEAFDAVAEVLENIVGDANKALAWRKRAWEAAPKLNDHLRLGRLALSTGDDAKASISFKRFIARYAVERGRSPAAGFIAGPASSVLNSYLSRGRYRDAEKFLDHLDASLGSTPWVGARRVRLLLAQGKSQQALEILTKTPSLLGDVKGANSILQSLLDHDLANEALALVDRVVEDRISPHLSQWQLRLRARLGRVEDAAESARELAGSGDPARHFEAGQILFSEGVLAAASKHFTKVIDQTFRKFDSRAKNASLRRVANAASLLMGARNQQGRPLTREQKAELIARASDSGEDVAAGYLTRARLLFADGNYGGALNALDEVLAQTAESAEQLRLLVATCVLLNDGPGLVRRLRDLTPLKSHLANFQKAATIAAHMNHAPVALLLVGEALQLKPGDAALRLRAVELAMQAGDEEAVERHAVAYTKLQERNPRSYVTLAALAAEHLYPSYSERWAKQARDAKGQDRHALNLTALGLKLAQKAATDQALADVIASAPTPIVGRLHAAELVHDLNGPPGLLFETLEPILETSMPPARALQLGSIAAWGLGKSRTARALLKGLVKRYPGRLGTSSMGVLSEDLLNAAVVAGDLQGVDAIMEVAARSGEIGWASRDRTRFIPAQGVMILSLAQICERHYPSWSPPTRQRFAQALSQRLSSNGGARSLSGEDKAYIQRVIRFMDGRDANAFEPYNKVLQRNPAATTLSNNLAYGLARRERELPRALALVNRAIALNQPYGPNGSAVDHGGTLATYLDTKAWVLFKMGRVKRALQLQRRAVHLMGGAVAKTPRSILSTLRERLPLYRVSRGHETEVFYHLGLIQRANGLERQARNTLRDCARRAPRSPYGKKCKVALTEAARRH